MRIMKKSIGALMRQNNVLAFPLQNVWMNLKLRFMCPNHLIVY